MAARRRSKGSGLIGKALAATFRASHSVPAVGFLIAAILGVGWWKLRNDPSSVMQWLALILGVLAVFFIVVALAGFGLILLERSRKPRR